MHVNHGLTPVFPATTRNLNAMGILKTKELNKLGYTNDKARSLVINIIAKHFKHNSLDYITDLLTQIKSNPETYINHESLGKIAETFMEKTPGRNFQSFSLLEQPAQLKIYGKKEIDSGTKKQMELAMSLPVAVRGALMPDAHTGYGLPIGGVLATNNAVIPYAIGVDIGCRMSLSILDEGESFFKRYAHQMKVSLKNLTHFGMEGTLETLPYHEILDSPVFNDTEFLKRLQGKAARQLGTSGGGNHFVEFGDRIIRK